MLLQFGSKRAPEEDPVQVLKYLQIKFEKNLITLVTWVDVMITIFCDFSQFSAKKLAFLLNTNVMIKLLQNFAYFSFVLNQKRHFFH
jgi:hypothetical protein